MQKRVTKNDLARAVEAFMKTPFPERSADDTADQLHADMLLFDSAAGEAVMTVINGGRIPREDLRPDDDLRQRLEEAAASENAATATDAQTYLDYYRGLEQLLEMARAAITKPKKRR